MEQSFDFKGYKAIANFVYNKYFKSCYRYKDDLISSGYLNMWKHRDDCLKTGLAFSTCMMNACYWGMLAFFKDLNGQKGFPKITETSCVSLDAPLNSDDEDLTFEDMLGEEVDFNANLNLEDLTKVCQDCKNKIKVSKGNKFTLLIIDMILQGLKDIDISNKLKCTRQLVSLVHKKFASELKKEMIEQGYCV